MQIILGTYIKKIMKKYFIKLIYYHKCRNYNVETPVQTFFEAFITRYRHWYTKICGENELKKYPTNQPPPMLLL